MKKASFIKYFLIGSLLFILYCVLYGTIIYRQYKKEEAQALQGISERTGLPGDWLSVREYVYCDLLEPGTPIDEVVDGLSLIGEYTPVDIPEQINSDFYLYIHFREQSTSFNLSPLMIVIDENKLVLDSGGIEGNTGPSSSCELERGQNAQKTRTAEAYPIEE